MPQQLEKTTPTMNETTANELLMRAQKAFPRTERPFARLGEELGLPEKAVLDQFQEWQRTGILREISAVMEGSRLGYDSALVCGVVPRDRLNAVAQIIGKHPTVTHLYERNYDYNLWFTIAVPLEMGLEEHLKKLTRLTGPVYYPLRRIDTFKIGVVFNLRTAANQTDRLPIDLDNDQAGLDPRQKKIVRALQQPLPISSRPFRELAGQCGLSEGELLSFLIHNPGRCLRKYVATLYHRKAGVRYNAMTVWRVPPEDTREAGRVLAEFPEVSHCYSRQTLPDFPYSLYAMVHGPDEKSVRTTVKKMATKIRARRENQDYRLLYSPTEFKKCRLRYFLPELEQWDQAYS